MKKYWLGVLTVLLSSLLAADIQFISPPPNTSLTIGTTCQIQWSGPNNEGYQTVTVFLATPNEAWYEIVDNTHTKADGGFTWEVGRLQNGTLWTTGGQYKMWLESDDGDSGEHSITLVQQSFGLDHPVANETLIIGTNYQVVWHGPTYEVNQLVTMFLEIPSQNWYRIVDNTHTKGQGGFLWQVGKLKDGTFAAPGQYTISLESDDGDYFGPTITLAAQKLPLDHIPEIFKRVLQLKIEYVPGVCVVCFRLYLNDLGLTRRKLTEVYELHLYREDRPIARLGKFGGTHRLPESVMIKLSENQAAKLKQEGQSACQLKVFSEKGICVHTRNVRIKLAKQRLTRLR